MHEFHVLSQPACCVNFEVCLCHHALLLIAIYFGLLGGEFSEFPLSVQICMSCCFCGFCLHGLLLTTNHCGLLGGEFSGFHVLSQIYLCFLIFWFVFAMLDAYFDAL